MAKIHELTSGGHQHYRKKSSSSSSTTPSILLQQSYQLDVSNGQLSATPMSTTTITATNDFHHEEKKWSKHFGGDGDGGGINNNNFSTPKPSSLPSSSNFRSSILVYVAVFCAQMSAISMGATYGWSAPALEDMDQWTESSFKPNSTQRNWIASTLTIGALIGAMFCGICMDFLGRKRTLIGLGIPYALGWSLIGFSYKLSNTYWFILIGRMITGISIGITTGVLPTYITEISTPNIRGLLGMTFNFFVVFGMVYVDIIYLFNFHWYQLALWGTAPAILLSLTMLLMPESPSWCVNHIRNQTVAIDCALESLNRLRSTTHQSAIREEMKELLDNANRMKCSANSKLRFSLRTITRKDVYQPLLIGMALLFFQQFNGINALQFYLNDIFQSSSSTLSPKLSTLISNLFMLFATVIGATIIDRFGRRLLYIVSALGLALSIGSLGVYQFYNPDSTTDSTTNSTTTTMMTTMIPINYNQTISTLSTLIVTNATTTLSPTSSSHQSVIPIICIIVFVSSFSLGVGPICWILITEITPPQTIALISSTSSAFAWIFTFIVVNYTNSVSALIGTPATYWCFATLTLCSAVFAWFLPETKGKTKEQIGKIFKYDEL